MKTEKKIINSPYRKPIEMVPFHPHCRLCQRPLPVRGLREQLPPSARPHRRRGTRPQRRPRAAPARATRPQRPRCACEGRAAHSSQCPPALAPALRLRERGAIRGSSFARSRVAAVGSFGDASRWGRGRELSGDKKLMR